MTTAAVVAYYRSEGMAKISYAGHPPVLYRKKDEKAWSYAISPYRKGRNKGLVRNIPLAVDLDTGYEEFAVSMSTGDQLFVYTDGVVDTPNPKGESFGLGRLKNVLDLNAGAPLSGLKSAVLEALNHFAQKETTHDDVTLIALEIG